MGACQASAPHLGGGPAHLGDSEGGEHRLIPRLHRAGAQRLLQRAGVQPDQLADLTQLCAGRQQCQRCRKASPTPQRGFLYKEKGFSLPLDIFAC